MQSVSNTLSSEVAPVNQWLNSFGGGGCRNVDVLKEVKTVSKRAYVGKRGGNILSEE